MNSQDEYIKNSRRSYSPVLLDKEHLKSNPFELFKEWLDVAVDKGITDANAMTLSTVSEQGAPSSRIVLLRSTRENGFVFYTNYKSEKGMNIDENPKVSLNFFWRELDRQIKISGIAEKITAAESDEYFYSRPRESQLGALASAQSEVIENRAELDNRFDELKKEYENTKIPRPAHWGGYLVIPSAFEFWQGRPNRLHDRFRYLLDDNSSSGWKIERLAP